MRHNPFNLLRPARRVNGMWSVHSCESADCVSGTRFSHGPDLNHNPADPVDLFGPAAVVTLCCHHPEMRGQRKNHPGAVKCVVETRTPPKMQQRRSQFHVNDRTGELFLQVGRT